MQMRWLRGGIAPILLSLLVFGCGGEATESGQVLQGRWKVIESQGMNVPNSFFWLTMDYVEFRQDGVGWALVECRACDDSEVRLNKIGAYALVGEHQIEFVGSCRRQDPCTGSYTVTLEGDL